MLTKRRGFTLIELLVVIAIIAIPAAILFPVFAQAREKARQASCLSNLKQTSLAVMMYTQDYDEMYPKAEFWDSGTSFGNYYMWSSVLCTQPYIKNLNVLRCPSDQFQAGHDAAYYGLIPATRKPSPLTYMANAISPFWPMYGSDSPQGLFTFGPEFGGVQVGATAVAATPYPADIVMLTEGRVEYYDRLYGCGEWLNNEIDWCYVGADIYGDWIVNLFVLAVETDPWYRGFRKHSGGVNVAFGDGHVKMQRPGDLLEPRRWVINPPA
ncbi:MAG: DUF1559 domain-containing protein [Chthonomonadales bacterium]|nr:DUF1559 domain-containing protein [Chthonomonadales bacterium]